MPFAASKALGDTENFLFADSAGQDGWAARRDENYGRLFERLKDWTIRKNGFCVFGRLGVFGRSEA